MCVGCCGCCVFLVKGWSFVLGFSGWDIFIVYIIVYRFVFLDYVILFFYLKYFLVDLRILVC